MKFGFHWPSVSEEKLFKECGRRTDRRQRPAYPICSPMSLWLRRAKKFCWCQKLLLVGEPETQHLFLGLRWVFDDNLQIKGQFSIFSILNKSENATRELFVMYLQKETRLVIIKKMHSQVKGLGYPSKQEVNDWNPTETTGTSFKCYRGSIFHVHILNSHLALFQPSEIRKEDSKSSHIA